MAYLVAKFEEMEQLLELVVAKPLEVHLVEHFRLLLIPLVKVLEVVVQDFVVAEATQQA